MNIVRTVAVTALAGAVAACNAPTPPSAAAATDGCLHYATGVTLTGKAMTRDVTAPGKMTRSALLLQLDAPTCVSPLPGANAAFKRIDGVREIELVAQSNIVDVFKLAGYRVIVKGSLATTQGDGAAAPVGLTLLSIKPADPNQ